MAGRPAIAVGEVGVIRITRTRTGFNARARTRDAGGTARRICATAATEQGAREAILAVAAELSFTVEDVSTTTTLDQLLTLWLEDRQGHVRPQTHRLYRDTVRWLGPLTGALTVAELRPARIAKILDSIARTRSDGAAHHARVALSGALQVAVYADVLPANPMRSMRRADRSPHMPKSLNVTQVAVIRSAILRREERVRGYVGPIGAEALRWVTEVQLGSGLRIAEVCALRHTDVDLKAGTISVTGTMIDDDQWHMVRQRELKSREQSRIIELPSFAVAQLAEARAACGDITSRLPDAPAIPGRRGNPVAPRNVRRSLRDLRTDPAVVAALSETGLTPEDLKPHIFRRTAATLVGEMTGDLRRSQALLGHADIRTTRASYAGAAYRKVGSASILQDLLGDGRVG